MPFQTSLNSIYLTNSRALSTLLMGMIPLSFYNLCFMFIQLTIPLPAMFTFPLFFRYDKPVKGRKINWMKAAILESNRVFTVSPYYAQELVSGEDRGVELDNIIRKTGITGIVNGMDIREWSPETDKFIDVHYDATTVSGTFSATFGSLVDIGHRDPCS